MKKYQELQMELYYLDVVDIVTASAGEGFADDMFATGTESTQQFGDN